MLKYLAAGALLLFPAHAAPPPQGATIDTVKVNGSGCRKATTALAMSPDKTTFTVTYSEFIAVAGAGTKSADRSKKCSITVRIDVPPNVTFAVSAVDHRGFAHLQAGATAVHAARYHVSGQGAPALTEHPMRGYLDDDWQVTDQVAGEPAYVPCGRDRKLDIDTELRVSADDRAPASMITMDSTDAAVTSTYRLLWKAC